jgi:EAL domain-containing protein (putative c-di-GMP-specific phosphodiesterase class I)
MLAQVARDIRTWLDNAIPFRHVSINLSMADFQRGDLDSRLGEAFARHAVSLEHIVLEVTESVFMDGPGKEVARAIERLRGKGMLVALDDFGTGFASLTHLLSFPVDIIKIDKCFIDKILTDRPSRAIVEALIDIARKLGMNTVAEGVEDAAQAECLREMGCVLGQGYHFARPADAKTTRQLLSLFAKAPNGVGKGTPGHAPPPRLQHAVGEGAAAIRPDWC